jgi:hypothetical protein
MSQSALKNCCCSGSISAYDSSSINRRIVYDTLSLSHSRGLEDVITLVNGCVKIIESIYQSVLCPVFCLIYTDRNIAPNLLHCRVYRYLLLCSMQLT